MLEYIKRIQIFSFVFSMGLYRGFENFRSHTEDYHESISIFVTLLWHGVGSLHMLRPMKKKVEFSNLSLLPTPTHYWTPTLLNIMIVHPAIMTRHRSGRVLDICMEFNTPQEILYFLSFSAHNWQKWKRVFLTCPCHKIYRDEAVGLKSRKHTCKITIFVKMWNLGQYRENLIFC